MHALLRSIWNHSCSTSLPRHIPTLPRLAIAKRVQHANTRIHSHAPEHSTAHTKRTFYHLPIIRTPDWTAACEHVDMWRNQRTPFMSGVYIHLAEYVEHMLSQQPIVAPIPKTDFPQSVQCSVLLIILVWRPDQVNVVHVAESIACESNSKSK